MHGKKEHIAFGFMCKKMRAVLAVLLIGLLASGVIIDCVRAIQKETVELSKSIETESDAEEQETTNEDKTSDFTYNIAHESTLKHSLHFRYTLCLSVWESIALEIPIPPPKVG